MSEQPVIGFIGVGLMGHGMAANILKNGYKLVIKGNRNRAPVEDLLSKGATEATTPRELAKQVDILHLCLSNSPQVEAILRGPDGVMASGKKGLIVIDCTTADPNSTMALADELEAAGMAMADAPLGRTPKEAEEGCLDAMVGASEQVFATIKPVIECWADIINHVGPIGTGHKMKLIMNFISMGYAALYAEALTMGVKNGVSPQTVQNVIGASRLSNGFFETFMKYAVGRDRNAHKFAIANAAKDVRYGARMATEGGALNVMGAAMLHYYAHVEAIGKGEDYVPMISDHVAALSGVDLAAEVKKGEG